MDLPQAETGKVTTPSKGYWLAMPPDGKLPPADWQVTGHAACPGGCGGFMYSGPLEELVKATALHACGVGDG